MKSTFLISMWFYSIKYTTQLVFRDVRWIAWLRYPPFHSLYPRARRCTQFADQLANPLSFGVWILEGRRSGSRNWNKQGRNGTRFEHPKSLKDGCSESGRFIFCRTLSPSTPSDSGLRDCTIWELGALRRATTIQEWSGPSKSLLVQQTAELWEDILLEADSGQQF